MSNMVRSQGQQLLGLIRRGDADIGRIKCITVFTVRFFVRTNFVFRARSGPRYDAVMRFRTYNPDGTIGIIYPVFPIFGQPITVREQVANFHKLILSRVTLTPFTTILKFWGEIGLPARISHFTFSGFRPPPGGHKT